ncbi:Hypothetical protein IALB_1365 [Ignavibacterium album JCM 16511]|uniref:Lipoprotein n=1 Tax=Ignavibacterium album (strain DSM 19864 / JCM 16511 / NBRC 101810 / Mat9-16) TaxID=945713 RepID=I0AJB8_IGNAJ|nr:hypothetical protein [Ignavibacterium album]AFH49075.1 Hypothetical protein IALB_1365 [Ignavibacterium album JCM 16511]
MSKIFASLALIILFTACEKSVNSGNIPNYSKYPIELNKEWEYNTIFKLEYYDLSGHIDSTEIMDLGNTICKITKLNDSVGNFSKLVLFEEYDVTTPQYIHKMWYLNADSGLYAIVYSNPGSSQIIIPKMNIKSDEDFIKIIMRFGLSPASYEGGKSQNLPGDSIQFYTYPRKVLEYPIRLGSRWVELIDPFYRERFIAKEENVTINGVTYNCFKVESDWNWQLIFNDYINLKSGLVMREFRTDSVAIINENSPDPVGYYRFSSISKLVRETEP